MEQGGICDAIVQIYKAGVKTNIDQVNTKWQALRDAINDKSNLVWAEKVLEDQVQLSLLPAMDILLNGIRKQLWSYMPSTVRSPRKL